MKKDNPFERWSLSPQDDRQSLTAAMRRRIRELDEEEREALREDWRALMDEPILRARWSLLTPPPLKGALPERSPWELAQELLKEGPEPELPELQPTLEDGLVLPSLLEAPLELKPPFLPDLKSAPDEDDGGDS